MTARSDWVRDDNAALFTDLYQLTMLQAYFAEGMEDRAVFDLFIRRLKARNYLVACGLETILHFLETLHFSQEALSYLDTLGLFRNDFLDYLADFRFTGDVYAVREGTPVFQEAPVLEIVAPIGQAQLVETFILNQITFQTNVASKAHRVVHAARGRTVADFGMRRMHGADAALKAARACYVAGVHLTSNVLAGQVYGIPVTGTMAHSYVEAHDREADAFRAFAGLYDDTTLLVDTYDTLDAVHGLVELARQHDVFRPGSIRLDSGDLAELAKAARTILDEGGLGGVRIFASNSLDEFAIRDLLEAGAPIDGFGVGTRLGTVADQPYLDSVFKLTEYAGQPRMKLSSEKSNLPGRKQVYRFYNGEGTLRRDVIALHDEELDGMPLLDCVMQGGLRTEAGRFSPLDEIRSYAEDALARLPARLLALDPAEEPYPVDLSPWLQEKLSETRRLLQQGDGLMASYLRGV